MIVNCRTLVDAAALWLGGEASDPQRQALFSHLAICTRCADRIAGDERMIELLAGARADESALPEPRPGYWGRFLPELHRRIEGSPRFVPGEFLERLQFWFRPAAAAAALAVLALLGPATTPPARVPVDAIELSSAQLYQAHSLSVSFDRISLDDGFEEQAYPDRFSVTPEPSSAESGELFEFFAATHSMTATEERALLEQLDEDFKS